MLEYSDINLIPRVVSTIKSRDDIKVEVKLTDKITLSCPILAAPMKDVCDGLVAKKMRELGGLGVIHRFCSIDEQIAEFNKADKEAACAVGVGDEGHERFLKLKMAGCHLFCVDVANGASENVKDMLERMEILSGVYSIVGNVASKECYEWLEQFESVCAIRTSVGSGKSCTTRNATGVYHPVASCIKECASVKKRSVLIADGGIREPQDLCKSIALGADVCMIGGLISQTIDSPAETVMQNGVLSKLYHGSASYNIQSVYKDKPKYVEGCQSILPCNNETLESLIGRFMDGLRSSMSYFNARDLDTYRRNCNL